MSDTPNTGPDPEVLRKLWQGLPDMAKRVERKIVRGNGGSTKKRVPRKICKVCCVAFDFSVIAAKMQPSLCERCEKLLKYGYTALSAGDKFAFVKLPSLPEMAGKIQMLTMENFDQIEAEFQRQQQATGNAKNPASN